MKRTLVVVAAVVGFATAASASTLTIFTSDSSNVVGNTFTVGQTILLKVTGVPTGTDNAIEAYLAWNAAPVSTVGVTRGSWGLPNAGASAFGDGNAKVIDQASATSQPGVTDTSIITLVADAIGVVSVSWAGTIVDFFGIYSYNSEGVSPTAGGPGHTFTIIPEPTTAGLIGLGLLGLVVGGRRRA